MGLTSRFLQAVEFVSMQHDDELWEELIKQCLDKPEMVYFFFLLYFIFGLIKVFVDASLCIVVPCLHF